MLGAQLMSAAPTLFLQFLEGPPRSFDPILFVTPQFPSFFTARIMSHIGH